MIKKQVLVGRNIVEVESNLSEVQMLLNESILEGGNQLKQIFTTAMDMRGMSMHSVNIIDIVSASIELMQKNLIIININGGKFSMAINETCNIVIQRTQVGKCLIFFEDFKMWLSII